MGWTWPFRVGALNVHDSQLRLPLVRHTKSERKPFVMAQGARENTSGRDTPASQNVEPTLIILHMVSEVKHKRVLRVSVSELWTAKPPAAGYRNYGRTSWAMRALRCGKNISKCGENISDTLGYRLVCHFFVLTTFWRHPWSITKQTHGNMKSIW